VLDPFAGSGVVAMEALKAGRKAIVCDLLPIATEITRLTLKPVDPGQLQRAFERVAGCVKDRILELYGTRCRNCRYTFPFTCAVWEKDRCVEIRYGACSHCKDRREKNCPPDRTDHALLQKIEGIEIKAWYPRNRLYYPDDTPFMKKERYESLDQLFTKRNLMALAWLMEAIEEEPRRNLRDLLKIAFTLMVHLCTKMVPAISPTPGSHQTSFSSTWSQHSYWHAPSFMEQNVWEKFESAVIGHQGLLKAIDPHVPKYLVIPQEREDQLLRKLRSPLFGEWFQKDSWGHLFAEVLESAFQKQKGKLNVTTLIAKTSTKRSKSEVQLNLFDTEHALGEDKPEEDS